MTWKREIKSGTVGLSRVGSPRSLGWGPNDSSTRWCDSLNDMAMNRQQYRRCYHFLSGQIIGR